MKSTDLRSAFVWALALGSVAIAQPRQAEGQWQKRGRAAPPPIDRLLEKYADRLGLEAETEQEIRRIAAASRSEARGLEEQARRLRRRLRVMLDAELPDEAAIMERADAVGALKTEQHKSRLRVLLRIRALLTPEQRAELVKIHLENRETRTRRGWGRGRDRRGGDFTEDAGSSREVPEER